MTIRSASFVLAAAAALAGLAGAASAQSRNITSNYGVRTAEDAVSRQDLNVIKSFPNVGSQANATADYDRPVSGSVSHYVPRRETGSGANVTSNYGYEH